MNRILDFRASKTLQSKIKSNHSFTIYFLILKKYKIIKMMT